jgi:uncharacterized membrane protein YhaH (DUF805 family)
MSVLETGVAPQSVAGRSRAIGPAGTVARLLVGGWMVGSVIAAEISGGFTPLVWILGLVAFPAAPLCAQWAWARHTARRLHATGRVGHAATIGLFMALYLTPQYAPAVGATSDAALVFFGMSMLLAAARGYAGCEILAVSNWLLRRDDQVGCVVFAPVDFAESQFRRPSR